MDNFYFLLVNFLKLLIQAFVISSRVYPKRQASQTQGAKQLWQKAEQTGLHELFMVPDRAYPVLQELYAAGVRHD